jgi:hypothetical protein
MSRARDVARSAQTALYRIPSNENTSASECSERRRKKTPWKRHSLTSCRRLSELQHEAEQLRKQLGSDHGSSNRLASPMAVLTATAEMSRSPESLNAYTPAIPSPQSSIRVDAPQIIASNIRPPPVVAREMPMAHSDDETQPRTLNNTVQIEGGEINDVFQMSV